MLVFLGRIDAMRTDGEVYFVPHTGSGCVELSLHLPVQDANAYTMSGKRLDMTKNPFNTGHWAVFGWHFGHHGSYYHLPLVELLFLLRPVKKGKKTLL